jgi:hypothetical protein
VIGYPDMDIGKFSNRQVRVEGYGIQLDDFARDFDSLNLFKDCYRYVYFFRALAMTEKLPMRVLRLKKI